MLLILHRQHILSVKGIISLFSLVLTSLIHSGGILHLRGSSCLLSFLLLPVALMTSLRPIESNACSSLTQARKKWELEIVVFFDQPSQVVDFQMSSSFFEIQLLRAVNMNQILLLNVWQLCSSAVYKGEITDLFVHFSVISFLKNIVSFRFFHTGGILF